MINLNLADIEDRTPEAIMEKLFTEKVMKLTDQEKC